MNIIQSIADGESSAGDTSPLDYYLSHWLSAVLLAVGFALGWFVTALRTRAEISKMRAESITEEGKTLKEIQHHRRLYIEATRECAVCVNRLMDVLRSDAASDADVRTARDAFCSAVGDSAIPRFHELVEWEYLDKKSSSEELKIFVESHVAPELARFDRWIQAVNRDEFVVRRNLAPYKLSIGTVQPFLSVLSGLAPNDRATFEPGISQSIASLRGARVGE
jgi:hypothetical protein